MVYFEIEESPIRPGEYVINANMNILNVVPYTEGSYNVLKARILGMDYVDFLLYEKKQYGGKITGLGKYKCIYYDNKERAFLAATELNVKLEKILKRLKTESVG